MNRRGLIKTLGISVASITVPYTSMGQLNSSGLKNNIKHSVCRGPYRDIPLNEFCEAAKNIGIKS